jgi:two-component system, NtrC family, response regulator PilR
LCSSKDVKLQDLPPHIIDIYNAQKHASQSVSLSKVTPPSQIPDEGIELEKLVAEFEKDIIEKALRKTGGVKKHAAKILGITFRSMRYRLEKYGME